MWCHVFLLVCASVPLQFLSQKLGRDNGFHSNVYYKAVAQNSLPPPQSTAAPGYVCVLIGTCPTNNTNVIDPRIVTPNQGVCPAGQEPCYGQGGGSQCGLRYVTNINTTDGIASYGAYPWQVYIENQTGYTGGGVLIDQYHVLTAAHKVVGNAPSSIRLYLGMWDSSSRATTQNRTAASITIYASFNASTLRDDLALIRMSAPVSLGTQSTIGSACLPAAGQSFLGQGCVVTGWGQTAWSAGNAPTRYLKQATVPIVDYNTCRTSMRTRLGSNVDLFLDPVGEICAGGQAGVDACTQDGGSPLVCRNPNGTYAVAGLVIWGKQCGLPDVYGVYVNLANPAYRTWIDQTLARLNAG